jgi:hypothetical protein
LTNFKRKVICPFSGDVLLRLRHVSGWKKVLIIFVVSDILVISVDFAAVFFFGAQFRSYAGLIFGNSDKATLSSLLFIEGALIVGIGASLAAGYAENRMAPSSGPATPYVVSKISEQREEFREKQISAGLVLMLLGTPLIAISIIVFII